MSDYSIYALAEAEVSISNGVVLDGVTQGDGSHLVGQTITLNSNAWEQIFITDGGSDSNFADNDGNQRLDGAQTIFGTSYANGVRIEAEYQFVVEDDDGNEYTLIAVNMNVGPGPAYGTVEGLAFLDAFPPIGETLTITSASEGPPNSGGNATPAGGYAFPPCFAPDTRIAKPGGACSARDIRPGDLIETVDDGPLPVRWVSRHWQVFHPDDDAARPVLIRAGALGPGRPMRDLVVSAQHRMLIGAKRQLPRLAAEEAFTPAAALTDLPQIRSLRGCRKMLWIHFAFDRHAVVRAEGALAESLLLGPMVHQGLPEMDRAALKMVFGEVAQGALNGPPARPCLRAGEVRRRIARARKPDFALAA